MFVEIFVGIERFVGLYGCEVGIKIFDCMEFGENGVDLVESFGLGCSS